MCVRQNSTPTHITIRTVNEKTAYTVVKLSASAHCLHDCDAWSLRERQEEGRRFSDDVARARRTIITLT